MAREQYRDMREVCADYPHVKARALDIVQRQLNDIAPAYPSISALLQRGNSYALRNAVGVALVRARDEVGSRCFRVKQHTRAQREIVEALREWSRLKRRQIN